MICCPDISRAKVKRRIDTEEIDRGIFEIGSRGERAAQDWRAGHDIRKTPADPHDLGRIRDPFKIAPARRFHFGFFGATSRLS